MNQSQQQNTVEKHVRKHRKHQKSRNGCPTCRRRKVKCDETLPACLTCLTLKNNVRCGYLDYTPRQIELIELAHWEKQGSDPDKIPIQSQQFNPEKQVEVIDFAQQPTPPTDEEQVHPTHSLRLVKHTVIEPQLDLSKGPVYFNETNSAIFIRYVIHNAIYIRIIASTTRPLNFDAVVLSGCGPLYVKNNELEDFYLRKRGRCIKTLLTELPTMNDSNANSLLELAISLDASSVFLKDIVSYKSHFKLSTGPLSIVQKVFQNPSAFPNSYPQIKYFGDSIINTTKSVWVPQYDYKVLIELNDVIKDFGEKYINIETNTNEILKEQYNDILEFIEFCIDLFSNDRSEDLVVRYPVDKLYDMYQIWYRIFPPEATVLDNSNMPAAEKVFYVFWFALLKTLQAIINSACYLFSFFLDGFFFSQPFRKTDITSTLENEGDDELTWYFNYCARVISFLDRRLAFVMGNTILVDPIPYYLHLKDRLRARPLDIHEKCIIKFRETVIKKVNYPSESTKLALLKSHTELVNYYTTFDKDTAEDTAKDTVEDFGAQDQDEAVDLLNNVNPQTSMLNNDYDPRSTNPIFNKMYTHHEADLDFIEKYIEDRRLIVQKFVEDEEDDD